MPVPFDAILLIAFGGPTSPEEIRPFLARVTKGIPLPPERLEEVAHHYDALGGKSPLNEITFRQAAALGKLLAAADIQMPVYVGFRNAAPFFVETLKQMRSEGIRRALGFILSSHRSEASWERYQRNIADACAELGGDAPAVDYCEGWHDHPLFIQTWVELISATFLEIDSASRDSTALIFTAHSLPVAMAARSPYVEQLETTVRLIADKLPEQGWLLAFQSRSGKPTDRWLEPDIGDAIGKLADEECKNVIVAPVGFVCDHVEVLYDLDIEARNVAGGLGMRFHRVSCPNDYPTFIRMIAEIVERNVKRAEPRG